MDAHGVCRFAADQDRHRAVAEPAPPCRPRQRLDSLENRCLDLGIYYRCDIADPRGRLDRRRHRTPGTTSRTDAGRLSQRDVRERRRADHRDRRASRASHRGRQGLDYREHHRQPAARVRPLVLRRRSEARPSEVQPRFRRESSTVMLFLATVALVMPALVALISFGSLDAHPKVIDRLSFWSSIVSAWRLRRRTHLRIPFPARSAPRSIPARPTAHNSSRRPPSPFSRSRQRSPPSKQRCSSNRSNRR